MLLPDVSFPLISQSEPYANESVLINTPMCQTVWGANSQAIEIIDQTEMISMEREEVSRWTVTQVLAK